MTMKFLLCAAMSALAAIAQSVTISPPIFTGSGLNDATSGGPYAGIAASHSYVATIAAAGTPDTVTLSRDGGSATSAANIVAGAIRMGYPAGSITAASWTAGRATYTDAGHGLTTNSLVTITGASPSGYNVTNAAVLVIDSSHFSVAIASTPGAWVSGGTVTGNDGVTITWAATTGHTAGDTWSVSATPNGSINTMTTVQRGAGAIVARNAQDKFRDMTSVTDFRNTDGSPVTANGTSAGNVGTSQTSGFQAAADHGGAIFIPFATQPPYLPGTKALCYMIDSPGVLTHSYTTWYSDHQGTCVQWMNSASSQVFRTDPLNPTVDVHWLNFTIDGNRNNATGIISDGGNYDIICFGCSSSSIERMMLINAYTDNVGIFCYGTYPIIPGIGFLIDKTWSLNARRNGGSQSCGLNTSIVDSHFNNTNGTNPEAGFDLEPFSGSGFSATDMKNTGFSTANTEFAGNNSYGLFLNDTGGADLSANYSLDVYAHDNCVAYRFTAGCAEVSATAFQPKNGLTITGSATGTMSGAPWSAVTTYVTGDIVSYNDGDWIALTGSTGVPPSLTSVGVQWTPSETAAIYVGGGFTGVSLKASAAQAGRAVFVANNNNHVGFGPGTYSGALNDLVVDGTNTDVRLAGAILQHQTVQASQGVYTLQTPLTGIPNSFTSNGLIYWKYPSNYGVQCAGSGTNTITCAGVPNPGSYYAGLVVFMTAGSSNTGASTLNISTLGAKNIYLNGAPLVGGELINSLVYQLLYDGTQFALQPGGAVIRSGQLSGTQNITLNDSAINPGMSIQDGSGKQAAFALVNSGTPFAQFGGVIGTASCLASDNTCRILVDVSGNIIETGNVQINQSLEILDDLLVDGDANILGTLTVGGSPVGSAITALTGDVTATGPGSSAATLAASGATAGTYTSVTVDAKGRVTAGTNPAISLPGGTLTCSIAGQALKSMTLSAGGTLTGTCAIP